MAFGGNLEKLSNQDINVIWNESTREGMLSWMILDCVKVDSVRMAANYGER